MKITKALTAGIATEKESRTVKNVIAAVGIGAALITTPVVAAQTASADPGQNCKTEWNTM
jgi:sporulation-control protein spo0M